MHFNCFLKLRPIRSFWITGSVSNGDGGVDRARHLPGPLRPDFEAARHDRVGMITQLAENCTFTAYWVVDYREGRFVIDSVVVYLCSTSCFIILLFFRIASIYTSHNQLDWSMYTVIAFDHLINIIRPNFIRVISLLTIH